MPAADAPTHRAEDPRSIAAREDELRRRLGIVPLSGGWPAWLPALAVTALAVVLRFWHLGDIHELIFDETYYVKDGYTLWQNGVEMAWPEEPNPAFEAGRVDTYLPEGAYVVHPPVGKWVIGAGMALLGADSSWGWRLSVAVLGSLSVLMLARIGRRLLRSTALGAMAGLLLAIDGLHLVESRTSLLDLVLMVFVLAAFGCLLLDRDAFRERLVQQVARGLDGSALGVAGGLRPWRLTAGVLLGLACGVKWSGLYVLAVFGILTVVWDWAARRAVGERHWFLAGLVRDAIPAFVAMVGGALLTYIASWAGWFATDKGYGRRWWRTEAPESGPVLGALRSLWHYHASAYEFHVSLDAEHPYEASPVGWLLQIRPTNFYYREFDYGQAGCQVAKCAAQVVALGNPAIWWLGTVCLLVALIAAIVRRDGRPAAALAGVVAGYAPWFLYLDRTVFTFYAVVFEPFLILCLVYVLGLVLGPPQASSDRRLAGALVVGSLLTLMVLVSAFFWPIWTGQVIDQSQWQWRMWLPSWP
ncbi:phospholipid carrier-dependent glycosyltransferase [Brachybacterium sp. EF45031]|uniref:dolichyl-phosphate-mannose--protein mannosyltransferase n=1 Tax=Brachybacterium sillae TaxID=2810536 RepID=UPI00217D22E4|nr:phospholipid carrier-dependent glycosyltransferase [Brachybacterium sillae]MCS6712639.1 phospholipid carrier-dependent glycosyltransferase [Brachybacterium sillae]